MFAAVKYKFPFIWEQTNNISRQRYKYILTLLVDPDIVKIIFDITRDEHVRLLLPRQYHNLFPLANLDKLISCLQPLPYR